MELRQTVKLQGLLTVNQPFNPTQMNKRLNYAFLAFLAWMATLALIAVLHH
jgi:hypothetical protein